MEAMKPLGFIMPPLPIVDFVPVYYGDESHPCCAEIKGTRISSFYPIDPKVDRKPIVIPAAHPSKQVGDEAFYCYLTPGSDEIFGEFNQVAAKLYKFLFADKLSLFQKLSLAYFFQYKGYQKSLIARINEFYRKTNPRFTLMEVRTPAEDIRDGSDETRITHLINLIRQRETVAAIYKKLEWQHMLYIDDSFVYVSAYRLSVNMFHSMVPGGKSILRQYLTFLSMGMRNSLLLQNHQLYNLFLDERIPDPISTADEAGMIDHLMVPGEVDNLISNEIEKENSIGFGHPTHFLGDHGHDPEKALQFKRWKDSFAKREDKKPTYA
jgi:hypothetical protein